MNTVRYNQDKKNTDGVPDGHIFSENVLSDLQTIMFDEQLPFEQSIEKKGSYFT